MPREIAIKVLLFILIFSCFVFFVAPQTDGIAPMAQQINGVQYSTLQHPANTYTALTSWLISGTSSPSFLNQTVPIPNWSTIGAVAANNEIVVVGGITSEGKGALGEYIIANNVFNDLSYLLPSPYASIIAIAFGNGGFLIGGQSNTGSGILGMYNPLDKTFNDLSYFLDANYGGINSIAWGSNSFLIGGWGQGYTPMALFAPSTNVFTSLTNKVPYYFATNHIAWDGNKFLVSGAKAGPGPSPSTHPAIGYVNPASQSFEDLSVILPSNLGVIVSSSYDGSTYLLSVMNNNDGTPMTWTFNPNSNTFKDVTSNFPTGLTPTTYNALTGDDKHYVSGHLSNNQAYLAAYDAPNNGLADLSSSLPSSNSQITSVTSTQNKLFIGGMNKNNGFLLVINPNNLTFVPGGSQSLFPNSTLFLIALGITGTASAIIIVMLLFRSRRNKKLLPKTQLPTANTRQQTQESVTVLAQPTVSTTQSLNHIFISHVEEDADVAKAIAKGLEKAGFKTWYYERDAKPGPSYLLQTSKAIEQSQAIIVVISPHSLSSRQVTVEVIRGHEAAKNFVPLLRGISHIEFQKRQPEWREAIGSATSTVIPEKGVTTILPRIIDGLTELGVKTEEKTKSPTS